MDDLLQLSDDRPTRSDAVKNRALLLDTAQSLFEQHGVEEVSMSAIAEEAGVGKGTLYRHFKNKAELCHALLDQDQQRLQQATLERLRQPHDALDTLRWFLAEVVNFVHQNEAFLYEAANDSGVMFLEHPAHLWWRQTIRGLLADLCMTGDRDYTADVLYVMLDATGIYFQRHALGYSKLRIIDGLHATLLKLID
jgi:AcrR family transcriptional regulator